MTRSNGGPALLLLPALACALVAGSQARAQARDERLERVFADWQQRQQRVRSVRYVVTGEGVIPKGSATDAITGQPLVPPEPTRDVSQALSFAVLFDFERGRFRMERETQVYNGPARRLEQWGATTVFDGKDVYSESRMEPAIRHPEDFDMFISKNYAKLYPLKMLSTYYLTSLLLGHGLIPRLMEPATFGQQLSAEDFAVHGQGVYADRPCLVLRTFPARTTTDTSFDEYWVDTGRASAVVRQLAYVDGWPLVDVEVTYQETARGWLPVQWTGTTRHKSQIASVDQLRVQEIVFDPPSTDADYQVEVRPGMRVMESTFDDPGTSPAGPGVQRRYFRVADNGHWDELVGTSEQVRGVARTYWFGVPAVAVSACVLWYVIRRRRRARARAA